MPTSAGMLFIIAMSTLMSINAAVYYSCGDASAHATTVLESLLTGPQSLHCCASLHKTLQHCESIVLHEQLVVCTPNQVCTI